MGIVTSGEFRVLQTFAEWLKKELDKKGWTRAELARRSNLKEATLTYISRGRKPSPETCNAIADALGLPSETVFRRAGLLPATPEGDAAFIDRIVEVLKSMTIEQRRAVLEYSLFEYRRQPQDQGGQESEDTEGNQVFSEDEGEQEGNQDSGLVPG